MSIIGSNILAGASGQAGYNLNNSLRFRSSNSANLQRTPASATNRTTWTWSAWIKRGTIGTQQGLFIGNYDGNDNSTCLLFDGGDNFIFFNRLLTVSNGNIYTTQVFRDPAAWYHIVVAMDTTQATAANRYKLYVNGTQVTSFQIETYPTQNTTMYINSNVQHNIGFRRDGATNYYFDGYMAEVNFIDGSQLTPSSFGETSLTTGQWIPKKYTGSYGTNGFYLNFSDTSAATAAAIGKDSSGNGNNWTPSGISVTAGVTYDAMLDVPTNTSATVANYAVMNPLWTDGTVVIAQGNLNVSGGNYGGFSTLTIPTSSKFYAEFTVTATQGNQGVGILKAANAYSGVIAQADMFGSNSVTYYSVNGNKFVLGGGTTAYGSSWGTINDVIGIAVDTINNQITFYKNNTSQGVITGLTSGIEWVFATGNQTSTGGGAWNFGQRPFSYTPPSGFVALNTYNLPTPTILQGNKYMDATTFTATSGAQSIVNAGAFKPDFVWVKSRSNAQDHFAIDSVRGGDKLLRPNLTNADQTYSTPAFITSFNSNGFSSDTASLLTNAYTYVAWQWQAGQGSTSSNTSGSITSTVSVNATAGFSVVTYTGTGANATVGHGLGVAPKMIIFKNRSSTFDWMVYHTSLGNTNYLRLNQTNASAASSSAFNNTSPTSTVFSLGDGSLGNNGSSTQIAYCFAPIAGYSAIGSYTGNNSTDGPFVYLGFRPKFIMIKDATNVQSWNIIDSARVTYNVDNIGLYPNLSNAESANLGLDLLSNGFKFRTDGTTNGNASGATYIYMAFAENPFKNANAR